MPKYDTERRDYPVTTPLTEIRPGDIKVLNVSSGVLAHYQKQMSKAVWRPAPGRKLGFLVMQDDSLLGLIFLASPVIRLTARDEYLFPEEYRNAHLDAKGKFNYGLATKEYMDVSVCVGAQPIAWHWNLGKLMALLAPTLGDYVETRYPNDKFRGVTTTSLWGLSVQYNRIYKFLGYTKGHGHEHINDETYRKMIAYLRSRCPHCTPGCFDPLTPAPSATQLRDGVPQDKWCIVPGSIFGDGANARMRRIAAYRDATGDKAVTLTHGRLRGVYYHAAVPPSQRQAVIHDWYKRWGLPRYERTKDQQPPYQNGLEGKREFTRQVDSRPPLLSGHYDVLSPAGFDFNQGTAVQTIEP
jgi:hypothetical protein